jgi:hypothetical protein
MTRGGHYFFLALTYDIAGTTLPIANSDISPLLSSPSRLAWRGAPCRHARARFYDCRRQRHCRERGCLARLVEPVRKMNPLSGNHATMAQRYSDWARQQVDRANRTLNPKARNDRLALAEYYLQLAEQELVAAKRLESAVGSGVDVENGNDPSRSNDAKLRPEERAQL